MIKKIESFFPIFSILPTIWQIIVLIWVGVGLIIFIVCFFYYYKDTKDVLNILPDTKQIVIPPLGTQNTQFITLGFSLWAKKGKVFEICLISAEEFDKNQNKYLIVANSATKATGEVFSLPILLNESKNENILISVPVLNKEEQLLKLRVNFVPIDVRNKIVIDVVISRGGDSQYQVAISYGKHHIELGRIIKQKGETEKKVNFLKKFKGPPEISISP